MNRILATAIVTSLIIGPLSYEAANSKPAADYKALELYADVFETVRGQYLKPVSDDKLVEASLKGMLAALDPHTEYMTPKEFAAVSSDQIKGEFGGVGVQVYPKNGLLEVKSVTEGAPAARADIRVGDLISQIDGVALGPQLQGDPAARLRGAPGTQVRVTLRHGATAEPLDVTVTREIIKIPAVRSRVESDNIGYIRISSFSEQTQPGLDAAIDTLEARLGGKLAGYVIDLRGNPGGLLDSAVSVSNTFIDSGEIVSIKGRDADDVEHLTAKAGVAKAKDLPIVVLIDAGTASAAEIVTGALQDHHRAVVLGTQSFGKGSVQTIMPLKNHGGLRLTTAEYFTPSGRSIQAKGITPDIEVHQSKLEATDDAGRLHEADLKGALPNPNEPSASNVPAAGGPGQPSVSTTPSDIRVDPKKPIDVAAADIPAPKAEATDYQLARAVDLLHGLAMFKTPG
jgi:carboxyl-terminal processing protease